MNWDAIPRIVTNPRERYVESLDGDCRIVLEQGEVFVVWMADGKDIDPTDAVRVPIGVVRALVGLR